ncbi:MAG: glycerol kinase GlpK [Micrococcaceae bacterium]|nr:glycerol kinase GlpK [Micrococcaceae bacterium]
MVANSSPRIIMSLDLGTTSTRVALYDSTGTTVTIVAREHQQYFPHPGWVEHDASEIWANIRELAALAMARAGLTVADIASIGITNQRETIVAWDANTSRPVQRAIVWQDARTDATVEQLIANGQNAAVQSATGLHLSAYFSAPKMAWMLQHHEAAARLATNGHLRFGTIDSWIIWNLTGGAVHATDITNASRTSLMDIRTGQWDYNLGEVFGIDPNILRDALPEIHPSVYHYGDVTGSLAIGGLPITGVLGDQQAASFGQTIFAAGEAKNTYGTGCFLLYNTGHEPVFSSSGLLTTVAYQLPGEAPVYALEGSVAQAGSVVQWLRDQLGIIKSSDDIERLANSVTDHGGVYFVPAFSGLLAPWWRSDASGTIIGLTNYATAGHIARATLDATAYQTLDVIQAVEADTGRPLQRLNVDGGMTVNAQLMQFQADILDVIVQRNADVETTARGAAYAAGLGIGIWEDTAQLRNLWQAGGIWHPQIETDKRDRLIAGWRAAIEHAIGWPVDETS